MSTFDEWEIGLYGSDLDWHNATGNCGGCGDQNCHPGQPCGDIPGGVIHRVCDLCPTRVATGEIEAVRGAS